MEAKQAIDIVEIFPQWNLDDLWLSVDDMQEFTDVVKKALEKHIPKKPAKSYDDGVKSHWYSCPICSNGLGWQYGSAINYCNNCGQKMDWRHEKWG